mgnify:CR=1 FL=1
MEGSTIRPSGVSTSLASRRNTASISPRSTSARTRCALRGSRCPGFRGLATGIALCCAVSQCNGGGRQGQPQRLPEQVTLTRRPSRRRATEHRLRRRLGLGTLRQLAHELAHTPLVIRFPLLRVANAFQTMIGPGMRMHGHPPASAQFPRDRISTPLAASHACIIAQNSRETTRITRMLLCRSAARIMSNPRAMGRAAAPSPSPESRVRVPGAPPPRLRGHRPAPCPGGPSLRTPRIGGREGAARHGQNS